MIHRMLNIGEHKRVKREKVSQKTHESQPDKYLKEIMIRQILCILER